MEKENKDIRNLLKLKPINFGVRSEKLSEEMDEILYDLKKEQGYF